jgi:hypothetical protein
MPPAFGSVSLGLPPKAQAVALTKDERDKLTPDQVIEMLKRGNERFRTGKMQAHDYLAQKRATAGGQYPAAAILSCIDSRTGRWRPGNLKVPSDRWWRGRMLTEQGAHAADGARSYIVDGT